MLCGRSTSIIHKHEGHYLPDFIRNKFDEGKHDEVVFKQIREHMDPKSLTTFQKIAYRCLHHEREERPTTNEVLLQLKKVLAFQVSYHSYMKTGLFVCISTNHNFILYSLPKAINGNFLY
ncbi:hypothetical protein HanXRQr2_Chr09g0380151 [Helianthus annuus]|uniref:Uncharacterized protein n=1 Tax=Helianthus annuus TaxID=4232 RepID=A0A9K3I5I8_HELAN|nr:hypothetical protein HanXRQr2_Chr09g0380151 [Helianthus annuus]